MSNRVGLVGRPEARHGHWVVTGPKGRHGGLGPARPNFIFSIFFIQIPMLYLNIEYKTQKSMHVLLIMWL